MPDRMPSTLFLSLNALKHNLLVIDSSGVIRFANAQWEEYNRLYGFSSAADCLEESVVELFAERLADSQGSHKLELLLHDIFQGTRLVSGIELTLLTLHRGSRLFQLDIFPLITEQTPIYQTAILTVRDIGLPSITEESTVPGPVPRSPRTVPLHPTPQLVPICASCKSVRNSQEEWITVERFLQLQLSLQFTHDICPDCIRELYPKYAAALKW